MRIVFMGTPAAAVPTLEALIEAGHDIAAVYTQPDRPAGRGNKLKQSAVKELALSHGLQVVQPAKIKTEEAIAEFSSFSADIAVVVAYGRILPESFLHAFPKGALNLHFSLLPKYRGAAPVNWAIVNGETATGVTVMQMDAGLDTGDILLQERTQIGSDENAIELMSRLAETGAKAMVHVLDRLDTFTPQPQDHSSATLAPIMRKEDGLIDWSMSARRIVDRVRGFQPFPTAFTMFRGARLTIWRAVEIDGRGDPGSILTAKADELIAACGSGAIRIEELQAEGKRRMAARDFINGLKPEIGESFG
jgi:methionyl-tRNA formyltransferase